jgi:hypothetical protein
VAVCQIAGLVAAVLMLPSALIDLAFDTDLLSILLQAVLAVLAAFAVSLIVAAWKAQTQK